jgi:hypothetical protein
VVLSDLRSFRIDGRRRCRENHRRPPILSSKTVYKTVGPTESLYLASESTFCRLPLLGHKSARIATHYSAPEFANLIAAAGGRAVEERFFGILAARAATPAELAQEARSSAGSRADAPMSEVSPRANWACPALRIFVAATRSALAS